MIIVTAGLNTGDLAQSAISHGCAECHIGLSFTPHFTRTTHANTKVCVAHTSA